MRLTDERGFTVVDVLAACVILGIALVGLLTAVPTGTLAVQQGGTTSTATFLAEQRLEQVKAAPWTTLATPGDCIGVSPGSPNPNAAPAVAPGQSCTNGGPLLPAGTVTFADETPVANWPTYNRIVRATDCGVAPGCSGIQNASLRLVTVTVTYVGGVQTGAQAVVSLLVSQR